MGKAFLNAEERAARNTPAINFVVRAQPRGKRARATEVARTRAWSRLMCFRPCWRSQDSNADGTRDDDYRRVALPCFTTELRFPAAAKLAGERKRAGLALWISCVLSPTSSVVSPAGVGDYGNRVYDRRRGAPCLSVCSWNLSQHIVAGHRLSSSLGR